MGATANGPEAGRTSGLKVARAGEQRAAQADIGLREGRQAGGRRRAFGAAAGHWRTADRSCLAGAGLGGMDGRPRARQGNFLGPRPWRAGRPGAGRRKRQSMPSTVPFNRVHSTPCPVSLPSGARLNGGAAHPPIRPISLMKGYPEIPSRIALAAEPGKSGAGRYLSADSWTIRWRAFIAACDPISMGLRA